MFDLNVRRSLPFDGSDAEAAKRPRVLVTGGSGFLGHHLVATLAHAGHQVRILDPITPDGLPEGVEYIAGSVTDPASARRAVADVDCVYHLAGIAHLWTPGRDDFDRVNRYGSEVMLAVAREMAVRRFVHCSSCTLLLPLRKSARPIDETVAVDPAAIAGPYSRSKYLGEEAARAAAAAGQSVVIVNPTVLCGPNDRNFTPPSAMLAQFLSARAAWHIDLMLNIVHVRDAAVGMMLAADRGRAGERYILGGENLMLRDVLDLLDRLSGRARRRICVPPVLACIAGFTGDLLATYLTRRTPQATAEGVRLALRSAPFDISKARRELGYAPRRAELALAEAIQWLMRVDCKQAARAIVGRERS
jgi:dihydroflavonol-4-reductase